MAGGRIERPARFCLILVKPSHYDDDGYVIQWMRSPIPSNSLASLYGLAKDCAERQVLGADVAIDIHAFDETNTRIRPERLAAMIKAAGAGMVMLVGVQSNQFPRALDLARPLREAGVAGLHRRLPCLRRAVHARRRRSRSRSRQGARRLAVRWRGRGPARRGSCSTRRRVPSKPLYNYMNDLPGIEGTPIPLMAVERAQRTAGGTTSFDAGRGLPVPVFLLHHHQCAGPEVAPALAGRCRADRQGELCARPARLLHHRRQFRAQQGLGADPRSAHPASPGREVQHQLHHPGRYALPQAAAFHREMRPRRRQARVHRAGEHQPRQSARREEAAEQDYRIPRDAARLEEGRRDHLCRLHSWIPQRHRRVRSCTTST